MKSKSFELQVGDLLMFKLGNEKDVVVQARKWIVSLFNDNLPGRVAVDVFLQWLEQQTNREYVHVEVYCGDGYVCGAWFGGVVFYKMPLQVLESADIYRPKMKVAAKKLAKTLEKMQGKKFDFASAIIRAVIKILSLSDEEKTKVLSREFAKYYTDTDKFVSAEFIAVLYEELGYKIADKPAEYVTPDDIVKSGLFYLVG